MRYVSFTFDDGRANNYEEAFPIMKQYNLTGTIYCTTGYIDGTWRPEPTKWKSAGEPLTTTQLCELSTAGWELGLHGDKHVTDVEDLNAALTKMSEWGFGSKAFGFSMPDSVSEEKKYKEFVKTYLGREILYIRKGRKTDTGKLINKILFASYSMLGCQTAYNFFNKQNIIRADQIDPENIYTIVIRSKDRPEMIARFLEQLPDETWIVFMFHSILPETHPLYDSDSWYWSNERFNILCLAINDMIEKGSLRATNVSDMINKL